MLKIPQSALNYKIKSFKLEEVEPIFSKVLFYDLKHSIYYLIAMSELEIG